MLACRPSLLVPGKRALSLPTDSLLKCICRIAPSPGIPHTWGKHICRQPSLVAYLMQHPESSKVDSTGPDRSYEAGSCSRYMYLLHSLHENRRSTTQQTLLSLAPCRDQVGILQYIQEVPVPEHRVPEFIPNVEYLYHYEVRMAGICEYTQLWMQHMLRKRKLKKEHIRSPQTNQQEIYVVTESLKAKKKDVNDGKNTPTGTASTSNPSGSSSLDWKPCW